MILSDSAIRTMRAQRLITIEPFRLECLGGNSYDVHLSKYGKVYTGEELDCARYNPVEEFEIPPFPRGYLLKPFELYLMSTVEATTTKSHVPEIDGKSSVGRLGISIHVTAGRGDVGFDDHWTLEVWCLKPTRVYAGMPIGQLTFHSVKGQIDQPYDKKPSAKYAGGARDPRPRESRMHLNLDMLTGHWK